MLKKYINIIIDFGLYLRSSSDKKSNLSDLSSSATESHERLTKALGTVESPDGFLVVENHVANVATREVHTAKHVSTFNDWHVSHTHCTHLRQCCAVVWKAGTFRWIITPRVILLLVIGDQG